MKRLYFFLIIASVLSAAAGTFALTHPAFADKRDYKDHLRKELNEAENRYRAHTDEVRSRNQTAHDERRDEMRGHFSGKLDEKRLVRCQEKSEQINRVLERGSARGTEQLARLDQIAKRIQEFYRSHSYTVTNYEDLVSAINLNREEVVTTLSQMNVDGKRFKCDGDNPESTLLSYREKHQAKNAAMVAYRASVRDLAVAIKASVAEKQKANPHEAS